MFKIAYAGGAINETKARWINFNLFTHPGAIDIRAEVACEVGISNPPSMKQVIKILGATMNRIFDLMVQILEQTSKCALGYEDVLVNLITILTARSSHNGSLCMVCERCRNLHGLEEALRMVGARFVLAHLPD